ncbi:MAG: copper amine oxidase N-terminal domain-containing protein [Caldisericia bacterium]|nr:copper amine oxidase N-terminal domain-containing protein [Caldisericia bacterium]
MKKIILFVIVSFVLVSTSSQHVVYVHANTDQFELSATGECGFVSLKWNEVKNANGYWIYRGTEKGKEFPTPLTDFPIKLTSYTDSTNIKNNTQYCYYVTAVDTNANEFARSGEACATTICNQERQEPDCKLVLKYQIGNSLYWVNDDSKGPMETAPVIINSRMFLVIRYVTSEIEGTKLEWIASQKEVKITTRKGDIIELWIGKKDAKINSKVIQIDPNNPKVVPVIKDGRTLLPMRFVGENLGTSGDGGIKWFDSTKTVEINVDDPVCEKEGFRYPKSTQLKDNLYEFSVEYHTKNDQFPDDVSLGMAVSDNSKTLNLGRSKRNKATSNDLQTVKTPDAKTEDIKSSFGKARIYRFRMSLEYGLLYFFRFISKSESMPAEGYMGPVFVAPPNATEAGDVDLEKTQEDQSLTIQGFFTNEPYPMIVEDYWLIFERANAQTNKIPIRLEKGQIVEDGTFVCLEGSKKTDSKGFSMLVAKKLLFSQKIVSVKPQLSDIAISTIPALPQCPSKFAVIFAGSLDDAKVKDEDEVEHVYRRLRVDFVGEVLSNYKTCFNLGICKQNISVCFGAGNAEIDLICADDGDGNPFDFEWNDRECRTAMENDAQRWWRAGDGWSVKQGSVNGFTQSMADIQSKIDALPTDVTPEVYIFIGTHGNIDIIGTFDGHVITYQSIVNYIKDFIKGNFAILHARSKIRILLDTCHAGSIINNMEDNFKSSGMDYLQVAVSSKSNELGYGIWSDFSEPSYAGAGGSFGIPFRISLDAQARTNPNKETDWKVAFDYAMLNDVFVLGVEKELDDGSTITIYTHPQYWRSRDMYAFFTGPAFEEPLEPVDEVKINTCRIGIDASNMTFDFCNCSKRLDVSDFPKSSFTIVNRGIKPFRVIDISADEEALSKTTSDNVFNFSLHNVSSCPDDSYIDFDLAYNESREIFVCIVHHKLNAQPVDSNGYMLEEDGLPKYVEVPIIVTYEFGDDRFTQEATARIRVKGESYQMSYDTYASRSSTIKGKGLTWDPVDTKVTVRSSATGLPEGVLAGPYGNGDIDLSVSTDIFKNANGSGALYGYLKSFKLDITFDTLPSEGCFDEFYWGWVSSAVLPDSAKGKYTTMYPTRTDNSYKKITIIFIPDAHSRDGFNTIIGKHKFKFILYRDKNHDCNDRINELETVNLNLEIEFTNPL